MMPSGGGFTQADLAREARMLHAVQAACPSHGNDPRVRLVAVG